MGTQGPPVVAVENLAKSYGRFQALRGLDLRVHQGEVHGFLGPNGAGKSTTIRVLLGLLRKNSGHAEVFGLDPWRDATAIHGRLAYVPGDVTLWPSLTGGEVIDVLCRLRGGAPPTRVDALVERFALDPTKRGSSYSKGNRQKVALVSAFATDPELLVLDEPTSGLDPLMEQVFTECVTEATGRGATVLLSSHILSEVEKLCDRVSIIRDGRTVRSGTLADLRELTRTTVDATTARPVPAHLLPGAHNLALDGNRARFAVEAPHLDEAIAVLSQHGITALTCTPPDLADLFFEHYRAADPAVAS